MLALWCVLPRLDTLLWEMLSSSSTKTSSFVRSLVLIVFLFSTKTNLDPRWELLTVFIALLCPVPIFESSNITELLQRSSYPLVEFSFEHLDF